MKKVNWRNLSVIDLQGKVASMKTNKKNIERKIRQNCMLISFHNILSHKLRIMKQVLFVEEPTVTL